MVACRVQLAVSNIIVVTVCLMTFVKFFRNVVRVVKLFVIMN